MSALDKVLALSRGMVVADDELLELTWSPAARAAAAASRKRGEGNHKIELRPSVLGGPQGQEIEKVHVDGKLAGHVGKSSRTQDNGKPKTVHEARSVAGRLLSTHDSKKDAIDSIVKHHVAPVWRKK